MDRTKRSRAEKVAAAMDLIVSKAGGLKARLENMQCMIIEARLDSTKPETTQAQIAQTQVLLHVVQDLETFVEEVGELLSKLLDSLGITQPSNLH